MFTNAHIFSTLFYNRQLGYCVWVVNLNTASGSLLELQQYLALQEISSGVIGDAGTRASFDIRFHSNHNNRSRSNSLSSLRNRITRPHVSGASPGDDAPLDVNKDCRIRYNFPIRTCFARCGHMVCCVECALKCDKCPICRSLVQAGDVIKLFAS